MIDTHCHLDLLRKEDREEALKDERLEYLINVGFDKKTVKNALKLAEHPKVFIAVGFHPHEADEVSEEDLRWLKEVAKHPKVRAIGETGLDFYKNYAKRENQERLFREQIRIAKELGLPLVVHMRDAEEETLRILEEEEAYQVGGVFHCFTGSYETMRRAVEMGFYVSYSGIITYKNAEELREVVKKTPTSRILLETDAPFLSPQPVRGKPNKPTNIFYTAKVLAQLLPNTSLQDVERMTTQNAKNLFNLGETVKKNTLFYEINGKLYVNLTNRCNLHCAFCQRERERNFWVKGHWVWTERDPSYEDFLKEVPPDLSRYEEVVFCGYGEPTLRFPLLKELAKVFKERGAKRVRVDTNGLLFTFLPKEKLKELKGLVDAFSVSLNAPDEETYAKVCRPPQGDAFKKVLQFVKEAKRLGFEVAVSAVDYEGVDLKKVEELAKELGVPFRGRHYEVVG